MSFTGFGSSTFTFGSSLKAGLPGEDCVVKTSLNHSGYLLASLTKLKCNENFCDVTIKSKGFVVKAHKVILASATDYFRAMFLNKTMEAKNGIVDFSKMSREVVKQCIEFIYCGKVKISMKIVRSLLDASEMMQLPELSKLCVEFLAERVDMKSCAEVIRLSNLYNKGSLNESIKKFLKHNFEAFSQSVDFTTLEFDVLRSIFDLLQKNNENSEIQKWNAIVTWTNSNPDVRKSHFPELFKMLNLQCMSESVIKNNVWTNSLVDESALCMRLIRNVLVNRPVEIKTSATEMILNKVNDLSHIVAINGITGLIPGRGIAIFQASTKSFPLKFNFEMDLTYHNGMIFIATGLRIYQFTSGKWNSWNVDFNQVKRNLYSIICSICHQDHWYLGMKHNIYMEQCDGIQYGGNRLTGDAIYSIWTSGNNWHPTKDKELSHKCQKCKEALKTSNFDVSCYNRCIGIEDSVYMLTTNYVIQYYISSSQIIHHNVVVGLGNGFCIAASNNRIYALGGNGTATKVVAFDLVTCKIVQLPGFSRVCNIGITFGYSLFKDNRLYVADRKDVNTYWYNVATQCWNSKRVYSQGETPLEIPCPPTAIHFGSNLLLNMLQVNTAALGSGSTSGSLCKRPRTGN